MHALVRVADRIPWQVGAAFGWAALLGSPLLAEMADRESPATAAMHNRSKEPSAATATALQLLYSNGFIVGLLTRPPSTGARSNRCFAV